MSRLLQNISATAKKAGKPFNCERVDEELALRQSRRHRTTEPALTPLEEGLLRSRDSADDGIRSEHSESDMSEYGSRGSDANEQERMLDAEERGMPAQNSENIANNPPIRTEGMDRGRPGRPGRNRRDRAELTPDERRQLDRLHRRALDAASRKATFDCLDICIAIGKCVGDCCSKVNKVARDCLFVVAACFAACGDRCTDENVTRLFVATLCSIVFMVVFIAMGFGINALVRSHQSVSGAGAAPVVSATLAVANATALPH